jgi:hypothetical protein
MRWGHLTRCAILCLVLSFLAGCPEEQQDQTTDDPAATTEATSQGVTPETSSNRPKGLNFENIQTDHRVPYHVQFTFSLRNDDGKAIELSESDLYGPDAPVINVWEDDSPLDPYESRAFIHTAPDLEMDVAFVLDFSNSMTTIGGIPPMLAATKLMMAKLKPSHRVLVEEFHDRKAGSDHSVLVPFTFADPANLEVINETIDEYATEVYHGFSTCWDAAFEALVQFGVGRDPNRVRHLYVFTDGHDTSSDANLWVVIALAQTLGVKVYTIGQGVLYPQDEDDLQLVAAGTGGGYFNSADANSLSGLVAGAAGNLGGNYKIAYVTPSTSDFRTKIHLTWSEVRTSEPINRRIRVGGIEGDDRKGRLYFTRGPESDKGEVVIQLLANHIPRDVSTLRVKVGAADQTVTVRRIQTQEGGILRGWSEFAQASDGWFSASGRTIGFGDFGAICEIVVKYPVPTPSGQASPAIPVQLDNSYYVGGIRFELIKTSNGGLDADGNISIADIPVFY